MNRILLFFLVVILCWMTGCHSGNLNCLADYDMVYLKSGKMVFYSIDANQSKTYRGETDSVVNAVYSDDDILYYTVSVKENLVLKSLDLKDSKAHPQKVVDWNLKLKDCKNYLDGGLGNLCFDAAQVKLGMGSEMVEDRFQYSKLTIYDLLEKELKTVTLFEYDPETHECCFTDEVLDFNYDFYGNLVYGEYEVADAGKLFYIKDDVKIPLTNQFNYREILSLGPDESVNNLKMRVISKDPDNSKMLYCVLFSWDDLSRSTYGVSSLDGAMQVPLYAETTKVEPQWLRDGSLAFVAQKRDNTGKKVVDAAGKPLNEVKVMTPDGTIRVLGQGNDFAIKRVF